MENFPCLLENLSWRRNLIGRAKETITPLTMSDDIIRMDFCPDCKGRGIFLINPFATGGLGGSGGPRNWTQCLTCKDAESYWREHGELPDELKPFAPKEYQ